MATACVPVAFQPVEYQGREFLDGGILNNLPIEPLIGKCDALIGVHVNSIDKTVSDVPTKNLIDRSYHLAVSYLVKEKADKFDLFIEPPAMSRFGVFDIGDADEIFRAGYEYTMSMSRRLEHFQKTI